MVTEMKVVNGGQTNKMYYHTSHDPFPTISQQRSAFIPRRVSYQNITYFNNVHPCCFWGLTSFNTFRGVTSTHCEHGEITQGQDFMYKTHIKFKNALLYNCY